MEIAATERLLIRHLALDDAPFIMELVNEPAWLYFIGDKGVRSIADAKQYLLTGPLKSYQENGFGLWLVQLTNSRQPIGMCGLIKRDNLDYPDIGFAFLAAHNGRGYGFEAATAVLHHAKTALALKHLMAIANHDNVKSIGLLEKLGFSFKKRITMPNDKQPVVLMEKTL